MAKTELKLKKPANGYIDNDDPAKQLTIASLIMAIFFSPVGLVLSIMSRSKSKKAGYENNLSVISIWVNAVLTVINIFVLAGIAAVLFVGFQAIDIDTEISNDLDTQQAALESFYGANGYYPATMNDLDTLSSDSLTPPNGQPAYRYLPEPAGCTECSSYRIEGTAAYGEVLGKKSLQPTGEPE